MCHENIKKMFLVTLTVVRLVRVMNVIRVITVISAKSVLRFPSVGWISSILKYL